MQALSVLASGMVTGVGLNAPASCAAIRAALDNFEETRFMDKGGEWIIGCQVPLEQPWRGRKKLLHLVVPAMQECLSDFKNIPAEHIPLLLCVAEKERPGRLSDLDNVFFEEVQTELGLRFHPESMLLAGGHVSGVLAVKRARDLIYNQRVPMCLIAGVDSFLVGPTLAAYEEKDRLLTSKNSNGFIPGEAGCAVLLGPASFTPKAQLFCLGLGFGREKATIDSEEPLRADGLVAAFKAVLADSGCTMDDVDFRITDISGEQYHFKEASLAASRTIRNLKPEFDLWHPADCIGEVGAAIVPCVIGVALAAARKNYLLGKGMLCHFGNDSGERATMILRSA
ncbi:hypothetical protein HUU05_07700 [candidate division KSB1 bacterium]|nr:hypothetical protein [candidate division KSB1 bacterium]